jgi:ABC-2 type transport system permease protein
MAADLFRGRGLLPARLIAILVKEFIQLGRDRVTFAMLVGIPIMQLVLFGFAINTDPKHMPTVVVMQEDSLFTRSLLAGLSNSDYFRVTARMASEAEAEAKFASGDVIFILNVPAHFSRDLVRGDRPRLLLEADASDPVAAGNAVGAFQEIVRRALDHDLKGALGDLAQADPPIDAVVHRRYNPEGITQFNIVPGLLGVVLTMSMIMMTAVSLTREAERGTMENLLAMPVTPLDVMLGKIIPYIGIGFIQALIVLVAAHWLFGVPIIGSLGLLGFGVTLFIAAMLAVGYTISTVAKSQMQAMQMSFFFFLPSIFLSGFMFPFRGMPGWAQGLGEILPLTHMLRILRGIVLKGSGLGDLWFDFAALTVFLIAITVVALARFRRTLD